YDVTFVGREVIGNVATLSRNTSVCSDFEVVGGGNAEVAVETLNDGEAMGTSTTIQNVFSDVELTKDVGAYRLSVNFSSSEMSTKCLYWDSTALEVETALESLNNVDSVEVERVGSGGEADRWGYTYSIFFDGNAFHGASTSASLFPPSLATNSTGCSSFSTTVDGVLTPLDNSTDAHGVMITDVVAGGFFLSHDVDASSVTGNLSVLPSVEAPMLTYRGVADEQNGNSWTMSFSSNEGAVAELVCITQDDFEGSCEVSALVDGNEVGGSFYLNDTDAIAADASAEDMEILLEATGLGDVNVTR
ncbi:unnamed protein product, partial [Sphacelaria rigidula]